MLERAKLLMVFIYDSQHLLCWWRRKDGRLPRSLLQCFDFLRGQNKLSRATLGLDFSKHFGASLVWSPALFTAEGDVRLRPVQFFHFCKILDCRPFLDQFQELLLFAVYNYLALRPESPATEHMLLRIEYRFNLLGDLLLRRIHRIESLLQFIETLLLILQWISIQPIKHMFWCQSARFFTIAYWTPIAFPPLFDNVWVLRRRLHIHSRYILSLRLVHYILHHGHLRCIACHLVHGKGARRLWQRALVSDHLW